VVVTRRLCRLWWYGELSKIRSWETLVIYLDRHGTNDGNISAIAIPVTYDSERAEDDDPHARLLSTTLDNVDQSSVVVSGNNVSTSKLGLKDTASLSFKFCMLWFVANYFAMACLQYTTVGSTTILTSTSGMWTLVFGAIIGVEKFTLRKFFAVLASLFGVMLISRVDMSSSHVDPYSVTDSSAVAGMVTVDEGADGTFPHKSAGELALGDAMAAFSAMVYGIYTIVMKKQVGDESRVNMQLFFGLVGFFNAFLLWPGFFILHFLGIEEFVMPPTNRIWTIILVSISVYSFLLASPIDVQISLQVNSVSSLVSDICWAYAMFLTTPLIVTVGLSLTIPLSLVGQIILQGQYASAIYWVGAGIVLLSFLLVNHESSTSDNNTSGSLVDGILIRKDSTSQPSVQQSGDSHAEEDGGEPGIARDQNIPLVR
jgi:solute carrier family 35 protein F5